VLDQSHSWMTGPDATDHPTPDFGQGKRPNANSNHRE